MADNIEISDVIKESKSGNIEAVGGLAKEQTVGILANVKKEINQAPDVITDKGLGSYGLTLDELQTVKVVKSSVTINVDLETTLNDKSVFTGKHGVNKVGDLLGNEDLQKKLKQEAISGKMAKLKQDGVFSGFEDVAVIAGIAGAAALFSSDAIKSFANGTASPEITAGIDAAKSSGEFAVNMVDTKASSTLEAVNGIGGGSTKAVKSATDTIQTPELNKGVDEFIGSKRVPSQFTEADQALLDLKAQQQTLIPSNNLTGFNPTSGTETLNTLTSKASSILGKGDMF